MLDSTPVHIAYARPFVQRAEIVQDRSADVSADRTEDVVEVNFRVDLSHLLLINLLLNIIMMFLLIRK